MHYCIICRLYYSNWSLAHLRVATSASVLQCMFIIIKHFFIVVNNVKSNWLGKNWENTSSVALHILLKQQRFIQPYLNHKVHNPAKLLCVVYHINHMTQFKIYLIIIKVQRIYQPKCKQSINDMIILVCLIRN